MLVPNGARIRGVADAVACGVASEHGSFAGIPGGSSGYGVVIVMQERVLREPGTVVRAIARGLRCRGLEAGALDSRIVQQGGTLA